MARAIDYAGVYPPARLPLAAAVAEYVRWHATPEAWMLGRLVCPAAAAPELAALWPAEHDAPLVVAAIGTGGDTAAALLARTEEDTAVLAGLSGAAPRRVIIDQLELKLPADLLDAGDVGDVAATIARVRALLAAALPPSALLAVEAPVAGAPAGHVAVAVAGIAAHNRTCAGTGRVPVCLKVRCGGLAAAAIPSAGELATAIVACRAHGVAIKATQGLHHPFRHHDAALGADTHGFLNLITAATIARAPAAGTETIQAVLEDREPTRFRFAPESLEWGPYCLAITDLAAGRRHGVLSFGSCSLAEPRDDLAALELI
jgi:hypothetical protein